jgi:hypothetical protein
MSKPENSAAGVAGLTNVQPQSGQMWMVWDWITMEYKYKEIQ